MYLWDDSIYARAKAHLIICSPLMHSVASNDSEIADSKGHDQRMHSLIRAFAVRMCPKTCFRMVRTIKHTGKQKLIEYLFTCIKQENTVLMDLVHVHLRENLFQFMFCFPAQFLSKKEPTFKG